MGVAAQLARLLQVPSRQQAAVGGACTLRQGLVTSAMTLFDEDTDRAAMRPMRPTESLFRYCNTSARPFVASMRDVQEQWFADYPEGETKQDLRSRFRSADNAQHRGAQFELFLHALLRAMGYRLEPHPQITGGAARPDFLALRGGERLFYAEATVAEPSHRRAAQSRGVSQIQEAIDGVASPDFRIDIDVQRAAVEPPPVRAIKRAARNLITGLNPEEVERVLAERPGEMAPTQRNGGSPSSIS